MSRDEAIEILSDMRAEYNLFGDEEEATRYHVLSWAIQAMKGDIEESAERKGKWIWMGDKGDSRFMCSVCKSKENVPTCNGEPIIWEFCPNCGARMRGEKDETDRR